MMVLYIVLGFLVPVMLVFGYSVWLHRRRQNSDTAELAGDTENTAFSDLVQRCTALKSSAITNNVTDLEEDIDTVLVIARSLKDQDLREQSLSQVMDVYVTIGRDKEARALLSEVKDETNRTHILKKVFGNVT
jgi:heme/copper-type cytochrome/quinol oxidase subunit 2